MGTDMIQKDKESTVKVYKKIAIVIDICNFVSIYGKNLFKLLEENEHHNITLQGIEMLKDLNPSEMKDVLEALLFLSDHPENIGLHHMHPGHGEMDPEEHKAINRYTLKRVVLDIDASIPRDDNVLLFRDLEQEVIKIKEEWNWHLDSSDDCQYEGSKDCDAPPAESNALPATPDTTEAAPEGTVGSGASSKASASRTGTCTA